MHSALVFYLIVHMSQIICTIEEQDISKEKGLDRFLEVLFNRLRPELRTKVSEIIEDLKDEEDFLPIPDAILSRVLNRSDIEEVNKALTDALEETIDKLVLEDYKDYVVDVKLDQKPEEFKSEESDEPYDGYKEEL